MDSVEDGATLQILYEGRTADPAIKDKHSLDTKFEDLFRERSDEEMAAIRKKYGASEDILEAENRIGAIARDLVDHYIDDILPDGFKAQVVCHSKLAAVGRHYANRVVRYWEATGRARRAGCRTHRTQTLRCPCCRWTRRTVYSRLMCLHFLCSGPFQKTPSKTYPG